MLNNGIPKRRRLNEVADPANTISGQKNGVALPAPIAAASPTLNKKADSRIKRKVEKPKVVVVPGKALPKPVISTIQPVVKTLGKTKPTTLTKGFAKPKSTCNNQIILGAARSGLGSAPATTTPSAGIPLSRLTKQLAKPKVSKPLLVGKQNSSQLKLPLVPTLVKAPTRNIKPNIAIVRPKTNRSVPIVTKARNPAGAKNVSVKGGLPILNRGGLPMINRGGLPMIGRGGLIRRSMRRQYDPFGLDELTAEDLDFIDDGDVQGEENWREDLRAVTRYDPSKYAAVDAEEAVESSRSKIEAEERISEIIAKKEDLEEFKKLQAERNVGSGDEF